jgi:hypothetical protein
MYDNAKIIRTYYDQTQIYGRNQLQRHLQIFREPHCYVKVRRQVPTPGMSTCGVIKLHILLSVPSDALQDIKKRIDQTALIAHYNYLVT